MQLSTKLGLEAECMTRLLRKIVFTLYERRRLRNWSYTVAFAIFVPIGLRFAILAWRNGDWYDRPLAISAGMVIGATAIVTLLRVWTVPPLQTLQDPTGLGKGAEESAAWPNASQMHNAAKRQAASNREMARGAAALGSSRGWPFGS